jgi:glycosyltransferase involved in cell wall biosynthesis
VDDTWVVVPVYNEAAVVGTVVEAVLHAFPNVVCVDDASTDASAEVARRAGAVVVQHPINLGQGAAIQTGLSYALADPDMRYAVTFDADGQHRVVDAAAMVARLRTEPLDVLIGSRFLDTRTKLSPLKRAVLRAGVAYTNATTGVRMTDAHNGLRAMDREVVAGLRITQNRMAHASEIVEQIGARGWRYGEHPVEILYTHYSRTKGQSVWNSVNILTELFFR